MQRLVGAHVPHLHLGVCAAGDEVPPRCINAAAAHCSAMAEHSDKRAAQVGAPHGDAPISVATEENPVVRVRAKHAACPQAGAMLRHKHARAGVLPSYDARLTAGSQEEEALQEFECERVLVVAHAVHLQSALVVDVHIPEQHSA